MSEQYSIEWFRELYEYHDEWLGEQARQLWKHYEELEQENEMLREVAINVLITRIGFTENQAERKIDEQLAALEEQEE